MPGSVVQVLDTGGGTGGGGETRGGGYASNAATAAAAEGEEDARAGDAGLCFPEPRPGPDPSLPQHQQQPYQQPYQQLYQQQPHPAASSSPSRQSQRVRALAAAAHTNAARSPPPQQPPRSPSKPTSVRGASSPSLAKPSRPRRSSSFPASPTALPSQPAAAVLAQPASAAPGDARPKTGHKRAYSDFRADLGDSSSSAHSPTSPHFNSNSNTTHQSHHHTHHGHPYGHARRSSKRWRRGRSFDASSPAAASTRLASDTPPSGLLSRASCRKNSTTTGEEQILRSFSADGRVGQHQSRKSSEGRLRSAVSSELQMEAERGARNGESTSQQSNHSTNNIDAANTNYVPSTLSSLPITALLDAEPHRVAFIVDLHAHEPSSPFSPPTLRLAFANKILRSQQTLLDAVCSGKPTSGVETRSRTSGDAARRFREWVLEQHGDRLRYAGHYWTGLVVDGRWRVVYGESDTHSSSSTAPSAPGARSVERGRRVEPRGYRSSSSVAMRRSLTPSFPPAASPTTTRPPWSHLRDDCSTRSTPPGCATEHLGFLLTADWAATAVGPMESWAAQLRNVTNIAMTSPNPAFVLWGTEQIVIHNAACTALMASDDDFVNLETNGVPRASTSALGKPARVGFAHVWDSFGPFIAQCVSGEQGATLEDLPISLDRGLGFREESYWTLSLSPIFVGSGQHTIEGWFGNLVDITDTRIRDRRMQTIVRLGETTARAQNLRSLWRRVADGLEPNWQDITFALVYAAVDEESGQPGTYVPCSTPEQPARFKLEASVGVTPSHAAAPMEIDHLGSGFSQFFRQAAEASGPLHLSTAAGTLPSHLIAELPTRRNSGGDGNTLIASMSTAAASCSAVTILKITAPSGPSHRNAPVFGFIVLGLSTYCPYDDAYRRFIQLIGRHTTAALTSLLFVEEESSRRRSDAQAAADQEVMQDMLARRTLELHERDLRLKHIADAVPVGIFVLEDFSAEHPHGRYAYRNDRWFEMTGDVNRDAGEWNSPMWARMNPDEADRVRAAWAEFERSRSSTSFEFRLPKEVSGNNSEAGSASGDEGGSITPNGPHYGNGSGLDEGPQYQWFLCQAFCILDREGEIKSIVGSLTDITAQKWAEHLRKKQMEDALESKRRQENFIDVTSHEMRNPLGAIMISADEILASLRAIEEDFALALLSSSAVDPLMPLPSPNTAKTVVVETLRDCIDAAQVIADCAQHQKRIVDDILTVSKLDSGLFSITPVPVSPHAVVRNLLKIFEAEFAANQITHELHTTPAFDALQLDAVLLDSSRLLQILINLVTNAIKFTKFAKTRNIRITMGASMTQPTRTMRGVSAGSRTNSSSSASSRRPSVAGLLNVPPTPGLSSGMSSHHHQHPHPHRYLPTRRPRDDPTANSDWGSGELVFLEFAVEDSGRGLSPDDRSLLFRRFAQLPKTHVHYGGSGLGLFISRELAEMHGGQIAVYSAGQGLGSDFSFYIRARRVVVAGDDVQTPTPGQGNILSKAFLRGESPVSASVREAKKASAALRAAGHDVERILASSAAARVKVTAPSASSPAIIPCPSSPAITSSTTTTTAITTTTSISTTTTTMQTSFPPLTLPQPLTPSPSTSPYPSPLKVLLVEDNVLNQKVLRKQLVRLGFDVAIANHGGECLDYLSTTRFARGREADGLELSIVLLDSEMPVMDGLTCVRRIRALQADGGFVRHVPVIAVTANARVEQVDAALEAGMDEVISKPFKVPELVARADELVARFAAAAS